MKNDKTTADGSIDLAAQLAALQAENERLREEKERLQADTRKGLPARVAVFIPAGSQITIKSGKSAGKTYTQERPTVKVGAGKFARQPTRRTRPRYARRKCTSLPPDSSSLTPHSAALMRPLALGST